MTDDIDPAACRRLWAAVMMEGVKNAVGIIHGLSSMSDTSRDAELARAAHWLDCEDFQIVATLSGMNARNIRVAIQEGRVSREDLLYAHKESGRGREPKMTRGAA